MSNPVPFPNGALEAFVEIAFGADIYGDQALWTWTDITPTGVGNALMDQTITTTRGRQDEASHVAPTQAGIQLDNPDGDLTPDNASSPYFPNVDVGTPARWGVTVDNSHLQIEPFEDARAQVNSTVALDITSDLDVRIDMQAKTTHPTSTNAIIVGRASDSGNYSWRLQYSPDRRVTIKWSTDGTPTFPISVTSSIPVLPSNARTVLRVTVDVNNGAGGHDVKFYLGESMTGPWTQVGATFTGVGVTTIFNVVQDLVIGSPPDGNAFDALDADVYEFWLLNGIDGPQIANPDFTIIPSGTTTFVDPAGRTWNMLGGAQVTNRWCRILGTIDSWALVWPWGDLSNQQPGGIDRGEARVDITISGILRRLGQGALSLHSSLRRSIEDEPTLVSYWPMEDGTDSDRFASAVTDGQPMLVGGEVTYADDSTLVGSEPLPKLAANAFFSGSVFGLFTGAWQVDWYVKVPLSGLVGTNTIMRITGTGTVRTWEINLTPTDFNIRGFSPTGVLLTSGTATALNFYDRWVHMRFDARQVGVNVDWGLHWQQVTYPPSVSFLTPGSFVGSVGGISGVSVPARVGIPEMHMGHLSVFSRSNFDPSGNGAMGWMGETALARMTRLSIEESIPFRAIGASADTVQVGPQRVATLLELLNDAADADGGILYEQNCAVGLIYRTRTSLYNQPFNLVLDGLSQQYANPILPVKDDQKLRNLVTVTRLGGSSSTVSDEASIAKHGLYEESVTLNLFLDSQTLDAAAWLLHQGTVPGLRYPSMTTNLGVAPEIIDPWLTVDVGSKAQLTSLPPQHPDDVELMIEGYSEPISPVTWNPTSNCSPASVWNVAQLPSGGGGGGGIGDDFLLRLETDGSILAVPATTTSTQLFVTVTDGPLWVTGSSEFPFDLWIGGEQVTVTGIGAPTGGLEFVNAGTNEPLVASNSFVAPSVNAVAANDLLIAVWMSSAVVGTYTLPGGMAIGALTSGDVSSMEDARQVLGAPGPTGTRTATFSGVDTWSAVTVGVHGAAGTPVISQYLSAVSAPGPVIFSIPAQVGDWLLAFQGWEWDPGANMGPPSGGGWMPIASSSVEGVVTSSRILAWAKRVMTAGNYNVVFSVTPDGVSDNHARLYTLSGVAAITQQFSVIRSVNNVVKAHPVFTDVHLWNQPVLAR